PHKTKQSTRATCVTPLSASPIRGAMSQVAGYGVIPRKSPNYMGGICWEAGILGGVPLCFPPSEAAMRRDVDPPARLNHVDRCAVDLRERSGGADLPHAADTDDSSG